MSVWILLLIMAYLVDSTGKFKFCYKQVYLEPGKDLIYVDTLGIFSRSHTCFLKILTMDIICLCYIYLTICMISTFYRKVL